METKSPGLKIIRVAWGIVALLAVALPATAADFRANPANYLQLLRKLEAGDRLILSPGQYGRGLPIHGMTGTAGHPIVISGDETGPRPVLAGRPGHNTISIVDSAHVTVRYLALDGRRLAVSGVKAEGNARFAHHITLENLVIRGHGANQQVVAISSQCPAWGWVIRGNLIVGAGTGMYLGGAKGDRPFFAGLIEDNTVLDTLGYGIQIKHQLQRPDLPGVPDGAATTVIRGNVIAKANGGSQGKDARPNLLIGHGPPAGPGVGDIHLIYANLFWQNPHEALFQGEGNLAVYNNLFVNDSGDAVNIQPHNGRPQGVEIFQNTVLARGRGISLRAADPAHTQRVAANAVFAAEPLVAESSGINFTASYEAAAYELAAPFWPPARRDFAPRSGHLPAPAEVIASLPGLPDTNRDFDGRLRLGNVFGAYAGTGPAKPLWSRLQRR